MCACFFFFKDVGKKKKEKRPLVSSLSYGGISLFPICKIIHVNRQEKNVKKQDNYDNMQENCVMQNKLPINFLECLIRVVLFLFLGFFYFSFLMLYEYGGQLNRCSNMHAPK